MAICPLGGNPATQQPDVDWFEVTVAAPVSLVAEAFYDVAYGDLDLAVTDAQGKVIASDGSAVSNACVATSVTPGTWFVVVVGAQDSGANRYELSVRTYAQPQSCRLGDMGPPRD
jgi:hypothetical protein